MTTVLAFESVGSILVIAMLVVPAAAASMLTNRLHLLLLLSLGFAACSAVLGHVAAITLPGWIGNRIGHPGLNATSSAAMMAVVAGALFFLAWCLSRFLHRSTPKAPGNQPATSAVSTAP